MTDKLLPFVKWVGGKRQLLPQLMKYLPEHYGTYYEPFAGGSALLFQLHPKNAVINDADTELMNAYQQVKDHPQELINQLTVLFDNDSKENYLKVRSVDRSDKIESYTPLQRASRLIYLNKAGFNGMWRVNSKGQNNVPYGKHGTMHVPAQTILNDSQYFNQNNIQFLSTDFESAVENAKSGDFVYFDPPYFPLSETSNFTSYTKTGFTYQDHLRLRELVLKLANKGVQVMVSNSYIGPTFEMYLDYPNLHVHKIYANRSINSDATHRGKVPEMLVTSY